MLDYGNVWKIIDWLRVNIFLGCSSEDSPASILQDCSRIKDAKILSDGEGCCAVFGASVYKYDNELYTVWGFCSCNEFLVSTATNPINCDGLTSLQYILE